MLNLQFIPQRVFLGAGLFLSALSLPHVAAADYVLGSYAGANPGFANGTITYTTTIGPTDSGSVSQYTGFALPFYPTALPNSTYVTYNDSVTSPAGFTLYSTSFLGSASDAGSIQIAADNGAYVYLNGTFVGLTFTYLTFTTLDLPQGDFVDGVNTLTFNAFNAPGLLDNPTDFDFEASVTGPSYNTPEPASLVLLGTGLLGIAGAARRRLFKA